MAADAVSGGAGSTAAGVVDEIRRLYAAKVLAEADRADALAPGSDRVASHGNPLARTLVLKGSPGPAEAAGGAAVSGADGDAIDKALLALGYHEGDAFYALTRPDATVLPSSRMARVQALIEAVDPVVVVALDGDAASDISEAQDVNLAPGTPVERAGRRYVAVDGLEASLGDQGRKRRVWGQLQDAAPPGPIY